MSNCSIKWCGKSSRNSNYDKNGITFHRFPKCPETKSKWIDATCRGEKWFPSKNSVVCSRHFTEDNFHVMKIRRRLMDTAVPTLFLPLLTHNLPILSSREKSPDFVAFTGSPSPPLPSTNNPTKRTCLIPITVTPSTFDCPIKKRLCRRIIELGNSIKTKNMLVKRLRTNNQRLKKKVMSLKSLMNELETKKSNNCGR